MRHLTSIPIPRVAAWLLVFGTCLLVFTFSQLPTHLVQRSFHLVTFSVDGPGSVNSVPQSTHNVLDILRALYQSSVVDIDASSFIDLSGERHNLSTSEPLRFTSRLGKRLLILDVDTRPLDGEGQVFSTDAPRWDNLHYLSAGILSHQLFALIHGYDYRFIRAKSWEGHYGTWGKIAATASMLSSYDWIVTLDADVAFVHPHLPLEWLFNYWNITEATALATALDPAAGANFDSKHRVLPNTGFMITQPAAPHAKDIYDAWSECTKGERYPGCEKWKLQYFHEQSALGEFIRYEFGENIKELPCRDANGCPEVNIPECTGQFLRHYWSLKHMAKEQFASTLMQGVMPHLWDQWKVNVEVMDNLTVA
ncbi:hypothetical protein EJ05DRAFT_496081 [Pseudovirgaria hyperparasitica]|uniref:Nucleotide-diphospho-sugar transferase domain-containing protein n=1 Tax=Pseudovirgaria hyperparasitica TaxID=470096 RepID=A0A6A6WM23_9PEZI|nr:uncharacterized protein EJ05DRAFT_496081 [Pseudovirgaria hyperparasitica]KAF2763251.1 hypothetical protein EJ05DRAFT_496081 [Pseudovirgaria hyperparasitica]